MIEYDVFRKKIGRKSLKSYTFTRIYIYTYIYIKCRLMKDR